MSLQHELRQAIVSFVAGGEPLTTLHDWLAVHEHAISAASDPVANDLSGEVWLVLAQYHEGYLDEAGVREALATWANGASRTRPSAAGSTSARSERGADS